MTPANRQLSARSSEYKNKPVSPTAQAEMIYIHDSKKSGLDRNKNAIKIHKGSVVEKPLRCQTQGRNVPTNYTKQTFDSMFT